MTQDRALRQTLIDHCRKLNSSGLNQGTSGNISVRLRDGFLISPTSMAYDDLTPEDVVFMTLDGASEDLRKPSSEWRFHRDIFLSRPDIDAIVHAHPTYATALAILGRGIPPVHYMVAIFGGNDVRCGGYALYGTQDLSDLVVRALEDRFACLMAHHGTIACGSSLAQAFWRAEELETLARQYHAALQIDGDPPLLSPEAMAEVHGKIAGYGQTDG